MAPVLGTGRGSTREYAQILAHDGVDTTSDEPSPVRMTPQGSSGSSTGDEEEEGEDEAIGMEQLYETRDRSLSSASSSSSASSHSFRQSALPRRPAWPYSAAEEQAVVRKFDRRLVLFVAALYLLSFLDRSNIGNARIAGMDADLSSAGDSGSDSGTGTGYEWALTAFYATYIAFEWMALLWRIVPAHVYVAALVAGWGLAASLQALAPSYAWLIAMRMLLGIGEAGFAGIPLYLAQFFRRDELALRTAVFIAAAPLATTFAASLAWAILALGRHAAAGSGSSPIIAPWRLLFLVEGFPSVVMAVVAWRVIPDAPDKAHYLTRREKKLARLRLRLESSGDIHGGDVETAHGDKAAPPAAADTACAAIAAALADPVSWLTAAMFFLANMAYSSLPVFLPTILADMGHDALAAQALAVPPYLAAFVVVLATAHVSDRTGARAPLLVVHALASAVGYGVLSIGEGEGLAADGRRLLLARNSIWRYLAVYPAAVGFFNVVVLLIAWNLNNNHKRGVQRQGAAFALFQVVGQCGPLVGTRLYPAADAPLFLRGMRTMAVAMVGVAVLAMVLRAVLRRRNAVLDAQDAEQTEQTEQAEQARHRRRGRRRRWSDAADEEDDAHGEADGLVGTSEPAARPPRMTSFRYML